MQILLIFAVLLLFFRKSSTDPPKQFNSNPDDAESITVDQSSLSGQPKPTNSSSNSDGTVTIKATITKAKAKALADGIENELRELISEEDDLLLQILQCKNDADYALVYAAFGEKSSSLLGVPDETFLGMGGGDLTHWLLNTIETKLGRKRLHERFPTVF